MNNGKNLTVIIGSIMIIGMLGYITYRDLYIPIFTTETKTVFVIGVERTSNGVRISCGIKGDLGSVNLNPYYPFKIAHLYNVTSTGGHIEKVVELPIP